MNICSLYFSLAILLGCGAESKPMPTPAPTPIIEPSDAEKKRTSLDGRSTWQWHYEQICKCKHTPLSAEERAAWKAKQESPTGGRFIFIDD